MQDTLEQLVKHYDGIVERACEIARERYAKGWVFAPSVAWLQALKLALREVTR